MSQEINLYELRLRPRRELATWRKLKFAAATLLLLVLTLAGAAHYDAANKSEAAARGAKAVADAEAKFAAVGKTAAQRQVSAALVADIEAAKAALAERAEIIGVLDSGKVGTTAGYSAFMSGFARQAQNDLWLTGFAISVGDDAIEIRGRLLDPARLPVYVQRLGNEPVFRGRRFAALEMRSVEPESGPAAAPVAEKPTVPGGQAGPARWVEFVLRSQTGASAEAAVREGK